MCEPTTLYIIAMVLIVAAAAVTAYGQQQAAKAASATAKKNERIARWHAEDAKKRGVQAVARFQERLAQLKGRQRAGFAAAGVVLDEGTPLDVLLDTAESGELESLNLKANAERETFGHASRSAQFRFDAKHIRKQGNIQAYATLLGGAASAASLGAGAGFGGGGGGGGGASSGGGIGSAPIYA